MLQGLQHAAVCLQSTPNYSNITLIHPPAGEVCTHTNTQTLRF